MSHSALKFYLSTVDGSQRLEFYFPGLSCDIKKPIKRPSMSNGHFKRARFMEWKTVCGRRSFMDAPVLQLIVQDLSGNVRFQTRDKLGRRNFIAACTLRTDCETRRRFFLCSPSKSHNATHNNVSPSSFNGSIEFFYCFYGN